MAGSSLDYRTTPAGRRAESRLRVRLGARMVLLEGTQSCVLADLSLRGAQVLPTRPVNVGHEAVLLWGPHEAFGHVTWTAGRLCGLAFYEPLAPAVVLATRALDACERLPSERDLARGTARAFVRGLARL